jgi:hypothetical protein
LISNGTLKAPELPEQLGRFKFFPLFPDRARVVLQFRNEIALPFNVVLRLAGIVRWTREMHRKDLDGLKRHVDRPHRSYAGEPAGLGKVT